MDVMMTLSRDEQRRFEEITTSLRADDPVFAPRLDGVEAQRRRRLADALARCGIWAGAALLLFGLAVTRGPISAGALIACYGFLIMVIGIVATVRGRVRRR